MKTAWVSRGFWTTLAVLSVSVSCADEPDEVIVIHGAGGTENVSGAAGAGQDPSGAGTDSSGASSGGTGARGSDTEGGESNGSGASGQGNAGAANATGGSSGGANAGTGGGSSSGGSSSSTQGTCVGVAIACEDFEDETACDAQHGCVYEEYCDGDPDDCNDSGYQTQEMCLTLPNCTWNTLNSQCVGGDPPACLERGPDPDICDDWPGCSWTTTCGGSELECSYILLEGPCTEQLGCDWVPEL